MANTKLGGWSELKLFTSEEKIICLEVKPEIEKQLDTKFKYYFPLVCRSQIVGGRNDMFKVLVDVGGDGECVHVNVFHALPCDGGKLSVTRVKQHKTIDDPLIPSEN